MSTLSRFNRAAFALLVALSIAPVSHAQKTFEQFFPSTLDPFTGEYVGQWDKGEDVDIVAAAQVFPLGDDTYRIVFRAKLDLRSTPKFTADAKAEGNSLTFKQDKYTVTIQDGVMTGGRGKIATCTLKKLNRPNPALGTPPPAGAKVLFDGKSIDAWQEAKGWEITPDGALMVTPIGDYLVSKETFGDVQLHVEFRVPLMPSQSGQARGNSGVFLNEDYEVQVLDSFGLDSYYDDCGAIYKVAAPMVNACRPPLEWQAYDITFRAARHDANRNVTENPRLTVRQNGVLIHNDQECWWITGWKDEDRAKPHPPAPGHIKLQGHNNFVQFRNVWALPLEGQG